MNRTAFVGACVLALGAPFELTTPVVRLPWQSVSNLELLLACVCGAWLASMLVARRRPAWRTPLTGPWTAFIVAMSIAALFAPADRVNAAHMAARLAYGVMLTFTRAGLATLAVSLTIVGVARYLHRGADRGARVVASLAVVIGLLVVTSRSTQAMWLRLSSEGQDTWYRGSVQAPAAIAVPPAATQIIPVRVTNLGRLPWDSAGDPPFFLSYHWLKADGTGIVSFEGVRT